MTKYKCINGWTKERMIARIKQYVPDTRMGCFSETLDCCLYTHEEHRCVIGALLTDDVLRKIRKQNTPVVELVETSILCEADLPLELEACELLQEQHDVAILDDRDEPDGDLGPSARDRCVAWVEANVED